MESACVLALAWLPGGGIFPTPVSAAPNYFIRAWQTENGLPQNSVTAVVQTRDGYLWLGTYSGLARFDDSMGQRRADAGQLHEFGPVGRVDIDLEVGRKGLGLIDLDFRLRSQRSRGYLRAICFVFFAAFLAAPFGVTLGASPAGQR